MTALDVALIAQWVMNLAGLVYIGATLRRLWTLDERLSKVEHIVSALQASSPSPE